MAKRRGQHLTDLPAVIPPDMLLTAEQGMKLKGRGRSKWYQDVKDGVLPPPAVKNGKFVRWRAGDLVAADGGK